MLKSANGGITWSFAAAYNNLDRLYTQSNSDTVVWDIAMAPDDPNVVIAVISNSNPTKTPFTTIDDQRIYITVDGGANWQSTMWEGRNVIGGLAQFLRKLP